MKMDTKIRYWFLGYLEAEVSFGVYAYFEGKKTKFVRLMPMMMIQTSDSDILRFFKKMLGIQANITKKNNEKRTIGALRLTRDSDIKIIVDVVRDHTFVSNDRQEQWEKFIDAWKFTTLKGRIYHSLSNDLREFVEKYVPFTRPSDRKKGEMIKKIQEHLM